MSANNAATITIAPSSQVRPLRTQTHNLNTTTSPTQDRRSWRRHQVAESEGKPMSKTTKLIISTVTTVILVGASVAIYWYFGINRRRGIDIDLSPSSPSPSPNFSPIRPPTIPPPDQSCQPGASDPSPLTALPPTPTTVWPPTSLAPAILSVPASTPPTSCSAHTISSVALTMVFKVGLKSTAVSATAMRTTFRGSGRHSSMVATLGTRRSGGEVKLLFKMVLGLGV
ncbi:hypothetical protein BC829DRAFT_413924 [Chytridium lagenaria]|nr:hypothetical protein BC829DRAFT_413924 [Chytridium lagenaria]